MKKSICILAAIVTCVSTAQESAPISTIVSPPPVLRAVRDSIIASVTNGDLVSLTVAVSQRGRIIWEESFGYADKERKVPATPHSIYALGSLSKSLVSTGMMKLIDSGVVRLTDAADPYLAPVRLRYYAGGKATVEHIMTMTAGIPHGWISVPEERVPRTAEQKDSFFSKIALSVTRPGSVYEYSNNSMGFVELMIEHISRTNLDTYMRNQVFVPLGMTRSRASYDRSLEKEIVTGYDESNTPLDDDYFLPAGGGGFFSSGHDLLRFAMFQLKDHLADQNRILSDSAIDLMHTYNRGAPDSWHLGFFGDSVTQVTNGRIAGANAHLQLKPLKDVAVVCLTNKSTGMADVFAGTIASILAPSNDPDPDRLRREFMVKYRTPYSGTADLKGRWEGFLDTPGGKTRLALQFRNNGSVYASVAGEDPAELSNMVYNSIQQFQGTFTGHIPCYESDLSSIMSIRLRLNLSEDTLSGYAAATFDRGRSDFSIPSYVSLQRSK